MRPQAFWRRSPENFAANSSGPCTPSNNRTRGPLPPIIVDYRKSTVIDLIQKKEAERMAGTDYDDLIASQDWQDKLADLNSAIADSLRRENLPVKMNGNLFYRHLDEDFFNSPMVHRFDGKRRNFFALARRSTRLFEIGVNGGHSLLLALMANPDLKAVGVDICEQVDLSWARVDIYVPRAFRWLQETFPGRVETIKGNSLLAAPQYALDHPDHVIDFLHLDGAKDTHLREVLALAGLMPEGAFVVHDDSNTRPVRMSDRQLRKINVTRPIDYDAFGLVENKFHVVRARN